MPSTYSTNLALELIGTGDQAGVWGNTTNTNLGTLIEQAISGYVTQAVATGTDTTITIPNGATGVARNMYIELTGTGGASTNLIVPSNKKLYFIFNNSTGAVTVKVSGQTGVSVPQGKKVVLVSNGTDIVNGLNYIADFGTNSFTVTNLTATSATITTLTGTSAGITTISSGSANITQLQSTSATITTLTGTSANIATLSGTTATFTSATVTNLALTSVTLSNLNIASANITTLTSSSATISTTLALSGGTANGVLYLNGSKVATSGSGLTYNGSTLATTGALTVDGNATLGNATTDAVTVSGYMGVGGAGNAGQGLRLTSNALTGTSQYGAFLVPVGTSSGTTAVYGLAVAAGTAASAYTANLVRQIYTGDAVKGAGSTITSLQGIYVDDLTAGTNNYGITSAVSSGSNKWNIYASGTANNYFAGNVGIGTSSPGTQLQVTGTGATLSGSTTYNLQVNSSSTGYGVRLGQDGTNGTISGIGTSGLTFWTYNGSAWGERLRIDSAGNMGLSVTPSAWGSTFKALQIGAAGAVSSQTDFRSVYLSSNQYFDGTNTKYIATDFATSYRQYQGTHAWFTAPSGTAGNTISFTQAMTLDASGRLLVGTTSARSGFGSYQQMGTTGSASTMLLEYDVANSGGGEFVFAKTRTGTVGGNTIVSSGDALGTISFRGADGSTIVPAAYIQAYVDGTPGASDMPGRLTFSTTADGAATPTERARITAAGDVGIGTTSPSAKLHAVQGISGQDTFWAENSASNNVIRLKSAAGGSNFIDSYAGSSGTSLHFRVASGEAFRVTSAKYFKASNDGAYAGSSGSYHELRSDGTGRLAIFTNYNATTPVGVRIDYSAAAPNSTTAEFLYCSDTGGQRAAIRSNGGLANYQSNNVDLSDARTKNSITPAASMWDKIGALEIVTYKYNDQTHDDVNVGVIAQQVESVEPVWVDADGFGETPEGEEPLKTVYTKDITFAAIKALQEAMARIEQLEAKVAALEAK